MLDKKNLARAALFEALRTRQELSIQLNHSVSAIECAERKGVEVRLVDYPSMEGIYSPCDTPVILLSSLRPLGRRNFTCAHELGHHVFGHGEQFDEIVADKNMLRKNDPIEFIADCFAGYFLMPKTTVESGLRSRGLAYKELDYKKTYALSCWLGVGYATFVNHIYYSLGMITVHHHDQLLKMSPKVIRADIYLPSALTNLHIVDENWVGRAVDCEMGDYIQFPKDTIIEGHIYEIINVDQYLLVKAIQTGIGRAASPSSEWASYIRVSPHQFKGRSQYRHEEEVQ